MTALFDIFRIEADGVRWLECAANLEEAKARVQQIAAAMAGEFIVVNQLTGIRIFLKFDGANSDGDGNVSSLSKGKGN